jgi:anti-sigma B factor antagonist
MENAMKLDRREHESIVIYDLDGDFDSRSAGEAKEQIRTAILNGDKSVIINLEGVSYIDSAGLGTLVSALKTAKENGGNVWLTGLTAQVKMVVELTRLHHVFDIYENLDQALAELVQKTSSEGTS